MKLSVGSLIKRHRTTHAGNRQYAIVTRIFTDDESVECCSLCYINGKYCLTLSLGYVKSMFTCLD